MKMNYILNIDTTSEKAIVNIADGQQVIGSLLNADAKKHASFLHSSIHQLLKENNINPSDLKAIGVTGGPGSYTGIRVGLATAKGLCFALNIPLMMFNTLEVIAFSAIEKIGKPEVLYCPMIDARRMEVFTAVYDEQLNQKIEPSAMILTEDSFKEMAEKTVIYFFGSGAEKFKNLTNDSVKNFHFSDVEISSNSLAKFSWKKFEKKDFEDIAYSKPLYIKEFFSNLKIG
jgi:tRNA threonylcarbamoyladenosine biosynthesis protein TsaB